MRGLTLLIVVSAVQLDIPFVKMEVFGCVKGKEDEWDTEWYEIINEINSKTDPILTRGINRIIYSHGYGPDKRTRQLVIQFNSFKNVKHWEKNSWPQLYKKAKPLEDKNLYHEFTGLNWKQWGSPRHDQYLRVVTYHIKSEHEANMLDFASTWLAEKAHELGFTFFVYAQTKSLPHTTLFLETFDTQEDLDTYVRETHLTGHEDFLMHPEGKPVYNHSTDIIKVLHGLWQERDVFTEF